MVLSVREMRTTTPAKTVTTSSIDKTTTRKTITPTDKNTSKATAADQTPFDPNTATERIQGLTTYVDAIETIPDARQADVPPATASLLSQHDPSLLGIRNFASRPSLIYSGTWSATDGRDSSIYSDSIFSRAILNSNITFQKLNNFQFISFDIVVRLIANPMQMQAGRLWLSYEFARTARGARACSSNAIQYTALSGLEYDPGMPAPVELRIPFYSTYSQWDTLYTSFDNGTLSLRVLSPLNSATTTSTLGFNLYTWIENLQLGVPRDEDMAIAPTTLRAGPSRRTHAFAQSNSEAAQAASTHRVSDTLDSVGFVADMLGSFPMLSSITTPVSWLSHAAATAARAFGFAKPSNATVATRVENFPQATATHMDGASTAFPLTASSNFEIPSGPHFGTEIDEMDINYICAKTVNIGAFAWNQDDSVGLGVAQIPVHPGLSLFLGAAGSVVYEQYAPTPMAYVASMFKYWAGSIKIRLEAVSTPFHAGRLLISYIPDFSPYSGAASTDAGHTYNIIWDITDSSHIEFAVPYMSNSPYLECMIDDLSWTHVINGETSGIEPQNRMRRIANGTIYVTVLAPLVSPSTTSSTIDLLIWVGGGEDLTFSEPAFGTYLPAIDGGQIDKVATFYDNTGLNLPADPTAFPTLRREPISLDSDVDSDSFEYAMAQSLSIQPETGVDSKMAGTAADSRYENWIPFKSIRPSERASLCTGEVITNLRLMTRRQSPAFHLFPHDITDTTGVIDQRIPTSNHTLVFDPDFFGTFVGSGDNAITDAKIAPLVSGGKPWLTELPSVINYISLLYTYVRGTKRYMVTSNPSSVIDGSSKAELVDSTRAANLRDTGMWDARLSQTVSHSQTPTQPWFMPEVCAFGYGDPNTTTSNIGINSLFGLGSLHSGDSYVRKLNTPGAALEVAVNSGTNWPVRVLNTPIGNQEASNNANTGSSTARARRHLELRYRPFSTSMRGIPSTFKPIYWPFPTIISEAAGDDMSFGLLQQAPTIRRIAKNTIFVRQDGTLLRL